MGNNMGNLFLQEPVSSLLFVTQDQSFILRWQDTKKGKKWNC